MKKVLILLMLALSLFARDKSNMPISKQASLKENYSSAEVTIQATGMGRRDKQAVGDLQKAAVYFVLYNGTDPLLNTENAQLKFEPMKEAFFAIENISKYITWEATKVISTTKTRLPDGSRGFKITKMLRVNRKLLNDYLVQNNVITSADALAEEIGLPFIMVIPETPKGETPLQVFEKNSLARTAAATVESYLTARKYDVVVPRASEQLNDLAVVQSELKGVEEDLSYQLALSLGADIYMMFSGTVENGKASIVLKAYETTTARLLGTETGYSERRPGATEAALVEEALNGAINNVLSRVKTYWMDDVKKGLQYKLVFKFMDDFSAQETEDIQFEISDLIDDMFSTSKENIIADKSMDYLVWAKKDEYKKSSSIYRSFKSELSDLAKISRITINKKFIVLGISQPE